MSELVYELENGSKMTIQKSDNEVFEQGKVTKTYQDALEFDMEFIEARYKKIF